jgi:hypothetical protein
VGLKQRLRITEDAFTVAVVLYISGETFGTSEWPRWAALFQLTVADRSLIYPGLCRDSTTLNSRRWSFSIEMRARLIACGWTQQLVIVRRTLLRACDELFCNPAVLRKIV